MIYALHKHQRQVISCLLNASWPILDKVAQIMDTFSRAITVDRLRTGASSRPSDQVRVEQSLARLQDAASA